MNNQQFKDFLNSLINSQNTVINLTVDEKKQNLKMKKIRLMNKINELLNELIITNNKLEKE